jgi:large subunit ribosomal protein L15
VGRGISAGQGKTCGRGTKGSGSRSGKHRRLRFEGGRQPLVRQLPKQDGFRHVKSDTFQVFNLYRFAELPDGTLVDLSYFVVNNLLTSPRNKVKILGTGEITRAINFCVHAYSESAKAKIEAAGGKAEVVAVD